MRLVEDDDEGQTLEFKPAEERPSSLATSLAAFANADGGTLLVGIAERTNDGGHKVHVVEGVTDVKIATDHLYTAAEMCTPKYELATPERIDIGGKTVLAVTVPEGLGQVYAVEGRYVAREGSHRRALTPDEIRALLSRRGLFTYDRLPVPGATRADLDAALVREFVGLFRSGRRMGADALLASRELLVRPESTPDGPLVPSVAGILLLGTHPQQFFPQARVAVVQYAGTTMGESFLKREIEGTVPTQLDEAEAWLVRNTLHAVELRGMDRIDRDEYPREALREAVLNALAHRDYSQRGDRVRIYAFADRVEVHSPGGLGGPMRLEDKWDNKRCRRATLYAIVQTANDTAQRTPLYTRMSRREQMYAVDQLVLLPPRRAAPDCPRLHRAVGSGAQGAQHGRELRPRPGRLPRGLRRHPVRRLDRGRRGPAHPLRRLVA